MTVDDRRFSRALMPALIIAELVSSFEGSMIYAALKQFYQLYHNPVHIGWLVSGYMLVASISAAICGRLGDLYGRQRVLCVALLIALVGSVISALSTRLEWIIVGRSVQGLAGAVLPLCYGLVREHCRPERIKLNIGIVSATASAGAGIGVILGGVLVDQGSWRAIFVFSAALALIAALMVRLFVPADRPNHLDKTIDWLGAVLFIAGMGLLLYTLGADDKMAWGSSRQLWFAFVAFTILAVWAVHEYRVTSPLIDIRMLGMRQIWVTLLIFILASLGSLNVSQIVMVMIQQPFGTVVGLGLSATQAGVVHLPASILGVIAAPLAGWLAGRRGGRFGMVVAMSMLSIAWVGFTFAHGSVAFAALWMAINGFGMGALMASAPILIVEVSPAGRVSEATGLAQIVRKISMACGAQLVAVSLARSTVAVDGGVYPSPSAYLATYGLIAALNIAGLALCLALPRPRDHAITELSPSPR